MAATAILDFEKSAVVGSWHHPDQISRGSEDSKTVRLPQIFVLEGLESKLPLFFWTIREIPWMEN